MTCLHFPLRLLALLALPAALCFSQDVTGSVQGRVTDPAGAAIPNVRLELVNQRTNTTATQTSNSDGGYIFNLVPPGSYTLRATATGFGNASLSGITVDVNRATRADVALMIGAWQVAGSIYANSGSALNVDVGEDRNYDANTPDRPNITGAVEYTSGGAESSAAAWIANPSVFVPAPIGELGNLSRNAVRGPGAWGTDFSVLKNFPIFEGKTIQFRAEAYNVLNHPNLGNPNLNLRNSDFNKIITRNGNRTMQMGFRFLF